MAVGVGGMGVAVGLGVSVGGTGVNEAVGTGVSVSCGAILPHPDNRIIPTIPIIIILINNVIFVPISSVIQNITWVFLI
jgi:hypothetical protein